MSDRVSLNSVGAIPEVARITLRQLLGRRRTVLLLLLAAVPTLLAILYRAAGIDDVDSFASVVLFGIAVTILLPIVAVLFGAAAFGAEIEDGTIVYLLAKPVARWSIVVAKLFGTAGITILLAGGSVLVASAIELLPLGEEGAEATRGFLAAMVVGGVCYVALFMALSLFTRRALVIGIGYILIWEGALSIALPGIANLSIRQYSLGVANAFVSMSKDVAPLSPTTALILSTALVTIAVVVATWRLMRFELPGGSD
jgi:ABC-2 type transport system permease protein